MTIKFELKVADESDFEKIVEVGDDLFDFEVKPDSLKAFLEDDKHYLVLAYYRKKVVGMASGFAYLHPDKDLALFVNEVAVIDELQGKGIGSAMVEYLCQYAKTRGCMEAWVATERTNIPARKAFTKAGGLESPDAITLITYNFNENS